MMLPRSILFLAIVFIITSLFDGQWCYAAPPRHRIAVLEFKPEGISDPEAAAVSDRLRSGFVNLGAFTVLDRQEIESVLREQAFQQQGITEAKQAVEVGKLLNVEYIVTGRVRRLGDAYHVNARMIQVKTAEIVRSEDILYRGDIVGLLSENMDSVAARLAQAQRGKPGPSVEMAAQPVNKPTWALWVGGAALTAGVLVQLDAQSSYDDAVAQANEARASGDPALYDSAAGQKDDALSQQTIALVIGGIGLGLLAYYLISEGSDDASALVHYPSHPPIVVMARRGGMDVRFTFPW
jgi:TolB-like protein